MSNRNVLRDRARRLRGEMTEAEKRLWAHLRRGWFGCRFRRQQPIGAFIVDFVSFEQRLIVEVDGSQHFESEYDVRRDQWLRSQGFAVLRFWNLDVLLETEMVLETIWLALHPSPSPGSASPNRSLPQGEG